MPDSALPPERAAGEPELEGLLEALDRNGVAYVVGGSVAAMAHGAPGIEPGDLDVVPATDAPNLERLAAVLDELDGHADAETGAWQTDEHDEHRWVEDGVERPARPLDPADPATFDHQFVTRLGRLDVVPFVAGTYANVMARSSRRTVAGHQTWVAHPIDILAGMTGPRRDKDRPRVAHLRTVASSAATRSGIGFIGFRTDRFDEMVALFRDHIRLTVIREAPGATWFRLGADVELHVYADTDPDHEFFTTGPVVGLRVDDVAATRAALEADGVEMLTEIERTADTAWCHFRAPDGTVLEIIGPA